MNPRPFAALAVLALSGACGKEAAWPPAPAEVRLGEDACANCRMIVSDDRYAAQFRSRDGTVEFFDDLGCLLAKRGGPGCDPSGIFVRPHAGGAWVRGDRGFAARSKEITSPMGFGLAVFPTKEAAETEAALHTGATVIPIPDLLREGAPRGGQSSTRY